MAGKCDGCGAMSDNPQFLGRSWAYGGKLLCSRCADAAFRAVRPWLVVGPG